MNQHKISERLLQLAQNDLKVRERLMRNDQLIGGYHPEMEKVHRENAAALRQIIKEIGFPGISKVGTEASEAAWLIAQHAIAEPAFMKLFFELMTENSWDINKKHWAYLNDRILYFQGKPQRFGTQLNADGSIYPVMDPGRLNVLRMEYDLPIIPHKDLKRIAKIEEIERIENGNPDYVMWRDRVGWKT
ncbi:hypothetical protein PYS58_06495 [Chryseobacterium indologenes]|uniref:DUF6624 domain-containing protein n=1 Tax=Chryseobacterium indologenes TaxID=253 RepID=UPI0023E7CFA5|nr:DUF6624 domain-containing protein [Chryseobacterium indologenes]WET50776.1 hypothetical protein PYS58_06495 [Chryseobacterium indologenes]